jgi:hypothetical protein
MPPTCPDPPATDWPLYWFAALERAIDDGDFAGADRATRELRRLGVDVVYRRRPVVQRPEGGCTDASS